MKTRIPLTLFLVFLSLFAKANDDHHAAPAPAAEVTPHEVMTVAPTPTAPGTESVAKKEAAHSEHKREAGPVKPEQSLGWLKNGNTRFTQHRLRRDGTTKNDIAKLASGQKPHAIVLSCSDSRVPPEVVFDQKLGEIFVVRTAGQSLDFAGIASIEYAVSHLGTNLIVVMGHESCGAVKAALGTLKGGDAGSTWLNQLVKDLHPRLKRFTDLTPTEGVITESWVNVEGATKELLEKSEIVRSLVEAGDVKIEKALYHLGNGEVEWR